jgi:hypothetical protein
MNASQQTNLVKQIITPAWLPDVRVRSDVAGTMISGTSRAVLGMIGDRLRSYGFDVIWLGDNMISAALDD